MRGTTWNKWSLDDSLIFCWLCILPTAPYGSHDFPPSCQGVVRYQGECVLLRFHKNPPNIISHSIPRSIRVFRLELGGDGLRGVIVGFSLALEFEASPICRANGAKVTSPEQRPRVAHGLSSALKGRRNPAPLQGALPMRDSETRGDAPGWSPTALSAPDDFELNERDEPRL